MEFGEHRVCKRRADLIVRSPCVCIVWFRVLTRGNYGTHSRFAVLTRPSSCSVVSKERQNLAGEEVGLVFGLWSFGRTGWCVQEASCGHVSCVQMQVQVRG